MEKIHCPMFNYFLKIGIILTLCMSLFGMTSNNASAHSGDTIDAVYGTTPTIDGVLSEGEWDDANNVIFTKRVADVTIYFKQDGENLYIGFDIPDTTEFDADDSGVNIDIENDGEGNNDDIFIELGRDGESIRERHVSETMPGPDDYNDYQDPWGWTAAASSDRTGWQVEYSISFVKINIARDEDRMCGIAFHTLDGSNGEFDWPTTGHIRDPSTFADIYSSDFWGTGDIQTNIPPSVSFSFSPSSPEIDEEVKFKDRSTDPDGTVVSWLWDFGDGKISDLQNPTHEYSSADTYTVTLAVTDNEGGSNYRSIEITVKEKTIDGDDTS